MGQIPENEMYEIFNMGIGLLLVISLEKMDMVKSRIETVSDGNFRTHMIGKFICSSGVKKNNFREFPPLNPSFQRKKGNL